MKHSWSVSNWSAILYPTKKHQPYPYLLTSLKPRIGPTRTHSHYRQKCLQDNGALDLQGKTIHIFK